MEAIRVVAGASLRGSRAVVTTRALHADIWWHSLEHHRSSGASEAGSDTGRHPALRTVNPSAYAYTGSNPVPATLVRPPFEGA